MNLKWICRCLPFFLLWFFTTGGASGQLRLAAMGGIHSSNILQTNSIAGYDTAQGQYYSSRTGFQVGVLAEIPLSNKSFFIQPGLFYSAQGNQFERFYDSSIYHSDTLYNQQKINLNYIEFPVYLTWKKTLSKDGRNHFFLSAGPYLSFIYSVSSDYQNRIKQYNTSKYIYLSGTEDQNVGNGMNEYKTFDLGITARTGFELGSVIIGAYYSRGFTNIYTASYPSGFHNQVIGASLGVWLNKVKTLPEPPGDTDHDGTLDPDDSCITIAGSPAWRGCPIPDTDYDGVNDEVDSCREIAGLLKYHGCPIPDTDKDDINDEQDSCKYVPGVSAYHGCPIPDRDRDGVPDDVDQCPDQPGPKSNFGCPQVKTEIVARAALVASNIMFNVNSIRLTKTSYLPLRELADSMKTNPDLDLIVEGHTDNTGTRAYNLRLSTDRATVVKIELIKLGIAETRIIARGFGDTQPLDSNTTAAGRAKNRRVVFVFQLKNR